MEFLGGLENSSLAAWIRESPSIWLYPTILSFHTFGLGVLVGASAAVNLRILGFMPQVPLAPMERFFPIMWIGFWVNAVSGVPLFLIAATVMGTKTLFFLKLALIAAGVVLVRLIRSSVFRDTLALESGRASSNGRILAASSLAVWVGAIVAGRLTAYL